MGLYEQEWVCYVEEDVCLVIASDCMSWKYEGEECWWGGGMI